MINLLLPFVLIIESLTGSFMPFLTAEKKSRAANPGLI